MKTTFAFIKTALVLLAICATSLTSFSQDGSLDPTFDLDGIVTLPIGPSEDDFGRAIAIQTDGKIVVAGYSYNGSQDVFTVTRYETNGSLDNSFDQDGIVMTPIGTSGNRAHAIAIQSDGKIVVAGYSYMGTTNDFAVARYEANGSLDNTFDLDGVVTTPFEQFSNDRAFSVAIQSDGKIVVAGYNTNGDTGRDFALIRYTTEGSLDDTFNSSGIVTTPIEIGHDEIRSVAIQTDGKIVAAGFSFDNSTRVFAIARYETNGLLDNTFDTDGIVTNPIGPLDDAAYAMAIQNDEKILLAGYTHGETYDFAIARYTNEGSLDNTFDTDGIVITGIGAAADLPYALALQSDGKILAGGHTENSDNNFALVRYTSSGSLDNTFDFDGIVTTEIGSLGSDDIIQAIGVQNDGKIVVAGSTSNDNYDLALARYTNSGTTGTNMASQENTSVVIMPNPFFDNATFLAEKPLKNATINIFNSFGQLSLQWINISGQSVGIHRENLSGGLYFVQVIEDNKTIASAKLKIND